MANTLQKALEVLKKEAAQALEFDSKLEALTTGSIAVDSITGIGGFPRGRVSEVFGWESSGKTTLLLSACAKAQRNGLYVVYLDAEHAVDLMHAKRLGFVWEDQMKGLYATPFSMEECFNIVNTLVETGAIALVVVDSAAALVPEKELKGDIDDAGPIGLRSRMMAQFLSRVTKTINQTKTALVFANQMRAKINTSWASRNDPTEQSAGGSALKFYTSLRLDLRRGQAIKAKRKHPQTGELVDQIIGNTHHAKALKNKVALPNRDAEFFIKYDSEAGVYGIDNLQSILELSKQKGVLAMKGAGFFSFQSTSQPEKPLSWRGMEEVYSFFLNSENMPILREIRQLAGI